MRQPFWAALAGLSCVTLMASPAFARAMMIAPPPTAQRVVLSDTIIVGKVTGFGDKLVSAKPPTGGDKVDYQIAIVQVEDAVLGAKDAKEIKVGFIPPPPPNPPANPGRPVVFVKRYPQFTLSLDQEALVFLVKHPTEDFYVGLNYYDVVSKAGNQDFGKDVDAAKHSVQLLADPMTALKGKNGDDRFLTAAMLLTRYRTARPGETKAEAIDAEESKQILQALADADWNAKPAAGPGGFYLTPQAIFFRLNLTPADGWNQPKDAKDIPDAAQKWLKDNAGKYRIQRFVAEAKDDKK